ncbi:peptidoglycan DD-metalloendopeptidase family protein [Candidatus Kuenenbacteria bacterium]|nr:peptidoglycan DD-metalloendopeptidase family protein [Candidatus Kuenenbacteria bacterium]
MLKIFSQLASLFSRFFLKITSLLGKNLWLVFFRKILVPFYKVFLFLEKKIKKIFFEDTLSQQLVEYKKSFRQKYIVHTILLIIFLLIIITNLSTKNAYADEFNKNSILAKIFIPENEEEIVEKSNLNKKESGYPKTETILSQLDTLESRKKIDTQETSPENKSLALLSQSGEALIKSNISPFTENGGTVPANQGNTIQTYTVQAGDTLGSIASRFNISINTLLWENNLSIGSYIRPGEKLSILPTNGVTYNIKSGDTLGSIAKKFGSSIEKILSYNNIADAANIKIKQKIIIPDGKPLSSGTLASRSTGSIKNIFSDKPATNADKSFVWPSNSRRITQYFSWRHNAIDIGAKSGSPIYAMKGGRVERAGWSTGYGYNIVVNHGNGVKSLYAHSRKLYVKVGDQVSQGEVLGEVGSTGWSTGPHIHLEIIINGSRGNPLSYL